MKNTKQLFLEEEVGGPIFEVELWNRLSHLNQLIRPDLSRTSGKAPSFLCRTEDSEKMVKIKMFKNKMSLLNNKNIKC